MIEIRADPLNLEFYQEVQLKTASKTLHFKRTSVFLLRERYMMFLLYLNENFDDDLLLDLPPLVGDADEGELPSAAELGLPLDGDESVGLDDAEVGDLDGLDPTDLLGLVDAHVVDRDDVRVVENTGDLETAIAAFLEALPQPVSP